MKKLIMSLILLSSLSSFAESLVDMVKYTNTEGCVVLQEDRPLGSVLYVSKGDEESYVGYGYDYEFATTGYCSSKDIKISYTEDAKNTKINIGCEAHLNGHNTNRATIDITVQNEELVEVNIFAEEKYWFGIWFTEVDLECSNLVKE